MQLWNLAAGRCWRCGRWIDPSLPGTHPDGLTIGHIRALALGGTNLGANLAPEHRRCNLSAGTRDRMPEPLIVRLD